MNKKIYFSWSWHDVKKLHPEWSDQHCVVFFDNIKEELYELIDTFGCSVLADIVAQKVHRKLDDQEE